MGDSRLGPDENQGVKEIAFRGLRAAEKEKGRW
jgi:hypothetical protein